MGIRPEAYEPRPGEVYVEEIVPTPRYWVRVLAVIVIPVLFAFLIYFHYHHRRPSAPVMHQAVVTTQTPIEPPDPFDIPHRHFRYSLIPGGVNSIEEFRTLVANDLLLATEFKNFNWSKAHIITVNKDTCFYMTFRRDDKIRYTKSCVPVKAGELGITDGTVTVLMRCGNTVSWSPQEPSDDLPPTLLVTPILPPVTTEPPLIFTDNTPDFPPIPPTPGPEPNGTIFPVIPCCDGGGGEIFPVHPTPPITTSEESPLLYIGLGLLLVFLAKRK